jgi:hypothetical protein
MKSTSPSEAAQKAFPEKRFRRSKTSRFSAARRKNSHSSDGRRTELVPANRTEHEKGSVQCLKDIRMAVIAAAIFLDENANEKHRDRAHELLMEVAEQFGIDWN